MLYSMGIIPIYMVFLNDQWSYSIWIANIVRMYCVCLTKANKIFLQDFIASIIFSFIYLIADIVWSVQTAALKNYVDDQLESSSSCLQNFAVCETEPISSTDSYLQLDISLVKICYVLLDTLCIMVDEFFRYLVGSLWPHG